ncbi:hypothetical protein CCR75_002317 [Bremia lactucae]|uniref:RxLR effector protein n=1 Tax=Bremia lactucae TaxID=4779 RepID=A0A976FIG1_BRELC|nr:hypothetical protein CCR75_002317 [Bremia lactucae]
MRFIPIFIVAIFGLAISSDSLTAASSIQLKGAADKSAVQTDDITSKTYASRGNTNQFKRSEGRVYKRQLKRVGPRTSSLDRFIKSSDFFVELVKFL